MTSVPPAPGHGGATKRPAPQLDDAQLHKAADDFEAMTIGQLLQPIFATVGSASGMFGGGAAEETFRPMMVTEIAKTIERNGGLGLAGPVYKQMLEMQEKKE